MVVTVVMLSVAARLATPGAARQMLVNPDIDRAENPALVVHEINSEDHGPVAMFRELNSVTGPQELFVRFPQRTK